MPLAFHGNGRCCCFLGVLFLGVLGVSHAASAKPEIRGVRSILPNLREVKGSRGLLLVIPELRR